MRAVAERQREKKAKVGALVAGKPRRRRPTNMRLGRGIMEVFEMRGVPYHPGSILRSGLSIMKPMRMNLCV